MVIIVVVVVVLVVILIIIFVLLAFYRIRRRRINRVSGVVSKNIFRWEGKALVNRRLSTCCARIISQLHSK